MQEYWKPHPIYTDYLISTNGNVKGWYKGRKRRKLLIGRPDRAGYIVYKINGKTMTGHRLVAETFIPNPQGLTDVNHIDEDKTNNSVNNLQWLSHKENCNYGNRSEKSRMTKKQNIELRIRQYNDIIDNIEDISLEDLIQFLKEERDRLLKT